MKLKSFILGVLAALTFFLTAISPLNAAAQKFIHPGIDQGAKDLAFMKKMVQEGREPYKAAFDRLKAATDTLFTVKAHTHVLRGPYGRPNIGGDDLSKSANMAYNYALVWYITNDRSYADKAIAIINAWSPVIWDFDYNDAKLLAAWTGHLLCNAAEILRYTNAGWKQKDIGEFSNMLLTVYYPLMRYYFPQANGNWDGAIIHSILAMAIFTDNRSMFNNAIDHFLHAPVNGSIFKYIYPNGQCQESPRDQGHVQLGLGEFAGAAQIAYTQGVDLFSIANNRIALGYEYTSKFLLGENPHCYCTISERAKNLRDDYEYVYRHYTAKGINLPWSKMAADSVRPKASRNVLASVRASFGKSTPLGEPKAGTIGYIAGAKEISATKFPADAIMVSPGQSIQDALNSASSTSRWVVVKKGIHNFPVTLKIPAGITLAGEGLGTVLFLDPASASRDAMVNAENDLHDITIRDLVIEGSNKTDPGTDPNSARSNKGGYNRGGIIFRSLKEGQMKNIQLLNITVRNCTYNGLFISGAANVTLTGCDFNENGGSVVPGPKLQHNVLLSHCAGVNITGSRMDTAPFGSGIAVDHCENAVIADCEIARNAAYGVLVSESKNVMIKGNFIEANDKSGVMLEFLSKGSEKVTVTNNIIHYNAGYGVESYAAINSKVEKNQYAGNGKTPLQQKLSTEKYIVME
ncbi:MAG: hypothetical protein JWP81_2111 [Ferruginibacter sp.]|nr:hypothetical protein [Ferruginibacter sp.]